MNDKQIMALCHIQQTLKNVASIVLKQPGAIEDLLSSSIDENDTIKEALTKTSPTEQIIKGLSRSDALLEMLIKS